MKFCLAALLIVRFASAQDQSAAEEQELVRAVTDANNSAVDTIRALENFLKKHPQTDRRKEIERALAKASIDSKDDRRIVLYGVPVLADSPQDIPTLDQVTAALLALGGRENAENALKYAKSFEVLITEAPPPEGMDAARKQDERDKAMGRTLLYESRAESILGDKEAAEALASR